MSNPSKIPQAVALFARLMEPEIVAKLLSLQEAFNKSKNVEDFLMLAGIPAEDAKRLDEALIPAIIRLIQASAMIAATGHGQLSPAQIEAEGANARPSTMIEIRQSAEGALAKIFEQVDRNLLDSVLAEPGVIESITEHTTQIRLNHFADGSIFYNQLPGRQANQALSALLAAKATSIEQITTPKNAKQLTDAFGEIMTQILEDQDLAHLPSARKQIEALVQKQALNTFALLNQRDEQMICYVDAKALATEMSEKIADERGQWKHSTTVLVDGQPVADIEAFKIAIGCPPPISLNDAITRLRASRQESASQSAATAQVATTAPSKLSGQSRT